MARVQVEREALIARYESGPARLKAALAKVPPEALQWRPAPGEWSAHEIVVHCADSEANAALRIRYLVAEMARVVRGGGRVLCIESAVGFAAGVDDELRLRTTGFTSPRIGRELAGLLRRAGLRDVAAVPHAHVTTDQPDVAALRAEFRAGRGTRALAVRDGWCAADEVERYFDQLERSVELGSYLECELHLAVMGKKPGAAAPG